MIYLLQNHLHESVNPLLENNNWVGIITSVTAIIAIVLSIIFYVKTSKFNRLTLEMTKKHNNLLVRPLIDYGLISVDTESLSGVKGYIKNCGLGPAIINQIRYEYRDKEYLSDLLELFNNGLKHLMDKQTKESNYTLISSETVIEPGKEIPCFNIYYKKQVDLMTTRSILKEINIIIEYKSIYGIKDKKEGPVNIRP